MSIIRLIFSLAAFVSLGACSGGSADTTPSRSSGPPYTKTCARTLCDTCRDRVSSNCSQCTSLCSRPGAYSGCFSDCSDICSSTCSACSGPSSCEQWEVALPVPALDEPLYESCLRTQETCSPSDYDRSYCNYFARTMRPETIGEFDCVFNSGCDASEQCPKSDQSGTLGTAFCERADRCGQPCRDSHAGFLNGIEKTLRPELKSSLQQCIAEPSCAEFKACARAHDELWQLAWEKADPGTPSLCWLSECGTCDCDLSCVQACSTCTSRCAMPCRTDSDCAGTTVASVPTPTCFRIGDDPGYCLVALD